MASGTSSPKNRIWSKTLGPQVAPSGFVVFEISQPSLHQFAFLACVSPSGDNFELTDSASSWKLKGACKAMKFAVTYKFDLCSGTSGANFSP